MNAFACWRNVEATAGKILVVYQFSEIQRKIVEIYHRENGVPGYRMMNDYLKGIGSIRSDLTIHHFMNELGLRSITRRKKPNYVKGTANKIMKRMGMLKLVMARRLSRAYIGFQNHWGTTRLSVIVTAMLVVTSIC